MSKSSSSPPRRRFIRGIRARSTPTPAARPQREEFEAGRVLRAGPLRRVRAVGRDAPHAGDDSHRRPALCEGFRVARLPKSQRENDAALRSARGAAGSTCVAATPPGRPAQAKEVSRADADTARLATEQRTTGGGIRSAHEEVARRGASPAHAHRVTNNNLTTIMRPIPQSDPGRRPPWRARPPRLLRPPTSRPAPGLTRTPLRPRDRPRP